jgi:hypothetical protein
VFPGTCSGVKHEAVSHLRTANKFICTQNCFAGFYLQILCILTVSSERSAAFINASYLLLYMFCWLYYCVILCFHFKSSTFC